jgi:aspartokinase/homoserine dehydrogenase 1
LRYIATLDVKACKAVVSLLEVDMQHPCYHVAGTDNVVLFYTKRYLKNPLVIKGPGGMMSSFYHYLLNCVVAGPDVTAAGVLVDILTIAR